MRLLFSSYVVLLLSFGCSRTDAQNVTPPRTLAEALAAEFKCPTGAHDSGGGPIPGTVVRWCDIQREGRPVYHGPLWRWYPSGKLEGKEYYINGDAAGVWPSYYENGHMSSLGEWESGHKKGSWKYWDEEGTLKTEVTYSEFDYARTDYYPSGRKKAMGVSTQSGKTGKWTYWDQSGNEKARCDFGRGVFSVSDRACQMIADELDPKGYSLPIPIGDKEDNGRLSVRVDSEAFRFTTPQEWTADVDAGRQEELPLVLYPRGKKWKAAGANMYVRVCFKSGRSFEQTTKDNDDDFEQNVEDYREQSHTKGRLPIGRDYVLKSITYKPVIATDSPFSIVATNQIHEKIAYLDVSDKVTLLLVLTADSQAELKKWSPAFQSLLESFH
jgi:MORN repeat variant